MTNQPVALSPTDYPALLGEIKPRSRHAQTRAVLAVNAELIRLYWDIGALIHARQQQQGWGEAVIPRLARDLHNEQPEEKGFSERNIKQMLAFYGKYTDLEFVQQVVTLSPVELILSVPWGPQPVGACCYAMIRNFRGWWDEGRVCRPTAYFE